MIRSSKKPSILHVFVRGHKRALFEGLSMPWKNPLKTILTIITLTICFYIPLFLWSLWLNYDELKQSWQNQGSIAVFLQSAVDFKEAGLLLQEIKEMKQVKSVQLLSSDEVINELRKDQQLTQFLGLITSHDLPKQINIKTIESASLDEIDSLVNAFEINPQVEYVSYDKQWLSQLEALTNTLLHLARASALMFMLIIMVILSHTLSNEISKHKNELRLLELMGASWAQVRRSFLYMGTFLGMYAGIMAIGFLAISYWWLDGMISSFISNFGIEISLNGLTSLQILIVFITITLVTWLMTRITLSTQRLNQIND